MTDTQRATLTVHIHLSMQSVVVDNIIWPLSDIGSGVTLRLEAQQQLKATYVEPIIEIARMTARAPIININHDPRFVAAGSEEAKKVDLDFMPWAPMLLLNYEFVDASSYMDLLSGPRWHVG